MRSPARLAMAAVLLATLAASASAQAATGTVNCTGRAGASCGGSSGPLKASMVPSTHTPAVNANWPLSVAATLSGKPAHASAAYEFLFGDAVVSTQYPRSNKHFTFAGHFSDLLVFPPPSKGEPLTLRVVIAAKGHTVNLDWSIMPK